MMAIHLIRSFGAGIIVFLILMSTLNASPLPRFKNLFITDLENENTSKIVFAPRAFKEFQTRTNVLYNDFNEVPDDILTDLMARFGQTILRARSDLENSKRTVDFGLARGFSGTQEAKHRMGLAAANFPGGPGRRRRSETEV